MRNGILYAIAGLAVIAGVLIKTGVFSVGISPLAYYRLNERETELISGAISRFREQVKSGNLNKTNNQLIDTNRDASVQKNEQSLHPMNKFGEIRSSQFFRAMPPVEASKYFPGVEGTFYGTRYLTKADQGEFSEDFDWAIKENGEVTLLKYGTGKLQEWEKNSREFERYVADNYSHEIRIPLVDRYIEIRY